MSEFAPYWVLAADGDPLPTIGAGLRRVNVSIGRKWVRVRAIGADYSAILKLRDWEELPHLLWNPCDQLSVIMPKLRNYNRLKPCQKEGTCNV